MKLDLKKSTTNLKKNKQDLVNKFSLKYDNEIKESQKVEIPILEQQKRLHAIQQNYQGKNECNLFLEYQNMFNQNNEIMILDKFKELQNFIHTSTGKLQEIMNSRTFDKK